MFNRILVPLDGSKLAERAIPHAEQFARIFGSAIVLLQVLDPTSYHENPNPVDPLSWQIRKTEADMYMSGIAARIREDLIESSIKVKGMQTKGIDETKDRVEYSIQEGKPAENIVNYFLAMDKELRKLMAPIGNSSLPVGRSDCLISTDKAIADRLQVQYVC